MAKTNATKTGAGAEAKSRASLNNAADNYAKFRAWMVEERNRQGLTQGDLAEMTGFHKAHISNVERRMREPSIDFVEAVGAALGVGRDDVRVIAGIDDPPVSLKPIPDSHTARLNRIRRRAEVEPSSDAEREEVIVLIEAVLDGVARRRRLHASN